jgi:hypothetical protein
MAENYCPFPEACLERLVERAIEEGKLFELMKKLGIKTHRRGKNESSRGSKAND